MASTNKTTNYNLSQFIGTDKPAWLSDYNGDMGKIDAGINTAQTTATGADGKADTANANIGTLASLNTTDKTSCVAAINEANTLAGTANTAAGDAYTLASGADTKATAVQNALTFTAFGTSTFSITGGAFVGTGNTLSTATNAAGSVGKMYGRLVFEASSSSVTVTANVPFAPATTINVDGFIIVQDASNGTLSMVPATFSSAGSVSITMDTVSGRRYRVCAIACVIFFTDFGD